MSSQNEKPFRRSSPWKKTEVFFRGLRFAIHNDKSVGVQMLISAIGLIVCFWFREWVDFMLVLITTGFMIASEIFNTVIENICDYVQPEHDDRIGQIKDIAASATGISVLVWTLTLLYEALRVWNLFY